jgi:hypothetical protein
LKNLVETAALEAIRIAVFAQNAVGAMGEHSAGSIPAVLVQGRNSLR